MTEPEHFRMQFDEEDEKEEDDEEDDDNDEQQQHYQLPPVQQVIHPRITCDECGIFPIVGIRYKARHIYNYDICQDCMKDHTYYTTDDYENNNNDEDHDNRIHEKFIRFDQPIYGLSTLQRQLFQGVPPDIHIIAQSFPDVIEQLERYYHHYHHRQGEHDTITRRIPYSVRINFLKHHHRRFTILRPFRTYNETITTTSSELSSTTSPPTTSTTPTPTPTPTNIMNHLQIKQLHISFHGETQDWDTELYDIVHHGLLQHANTSSIRKIFWHFHPYMFTKLSTAQAIHDLLACNNTTTVEGLYIFCMDDDSLTNGPYPNQRGLLPSQLRTTSTSTTTMDQFAMTVWNGLSTNTTLKLLRLHGSYPISEIVMDHLISNILITKVNTTLRKVYATTCTSSSSSNSNNNNNERMINQQRLNLALRSNSEKWLEQFNDMNASRVELFHLLWNLLHEFSSQQQQQQQQQEKSTNNSNDYNYDNEVSIAYHLLRSRPDFIIC